MLKKFCPNQWAASVPDVDLDILKEKGIEAIILDLDNTIVPWDDEVIAENVRTWIKSAKKKDFRVCIASNGLEERVKSISDDLGIPAISKAIKPRKKPFKRALELLQSVPENTVVIGDQIFTDILGGNRMEFHTILITPMSQQELRSTKLVRKVERSVIKRLEKKGLATPMDVELRQKND